ncbi:response regulator [bacterium M00.F.Ca.ET.228.01.1.1]|nr:response regulator [bacterium M00.F.Ca.ET.228.01.1.1]TGR95299.1 response regulator [bacterium M00.F.Ca.ET.191.01.1.1]TGT96152.1 response regulator [bacterium M00.F.Ca.ET.155.01.1.1]
MHTKSLVAIIDDDESVRVATGSLVRALGYDVNLYTSADRFLAEEEFEGIRCIVSDVQMPQTSGLEMYRQLLDRGVRISIIFLTAQCSNRVKQQAAQLGAWCVLEKPVDWEALSDELGKCVRSSFLWNSDGEFGQNLGSRAEWET